MSGSSSDSDDPAIRILLMGRKGSGKSSSGNTILGERKFKVKKKDNAEVCEGETQIGQKQLHVIDCPDPLDPDVSKEMQEELKYQLVSRCSRGLSAVLLTVPLEEPIQNEEEILDFIKDLFSPEAQKFLMVLFTHADELEEQEESIEEHLQAHTDLQQLVTECGGRFHCFNNKNKSQGQVEELLQKIEGMMMENKTKCFMEQMKRATSMEIVSEEVQIPEKKDLRLVLLGKTGAGKSAAGNTIIGKKVFQSATSFNSQTKQCCSKTTMRNGKQISVIDTPGLYDNVLSEKEVITELAKCITHSSPGPHTFIIVIKVGRFTEEEKNTIKQLKEVFGEKIQKYTMILFTHKDQLDKEKKTIEEFLKDGDSDLQSLVRSCGNRFFCLDNESASFPQFKELLAKIESMVEENGGHFTNEMFEGTERCIREIQKQKLREKVELLEKKQKGGVRVEWQKIYWSLAEESRQEAERMAYSGLLMSIYASLGKSMVTTEEKESAMKEAESFGISRGQAAQLAMRATRQLVRQTMCSIQ